MSKLTVLVGPPGAGKSTWANKHCEDTGAIYVNQDSHGKTGHMELFWRALDDNKDIVVDRMNFDKMQRSRYIGPAKERGYEVEIRVFHLGKLECLERILKRENHPTIKDSASANQALGLFFSKYERPTEDEADNIVFTYPYKDKYQALIVDLDGTLCNIDHRRHFVCPPEGTLVGPNDGVINVLGVLDPVDVTKPLPKFKKDWKSFFENLKYDTLNEQVAETVRIYADRMSIIYCSGRPDNYKDQTLSWLAENGMNCGDLLMRPRNDMRRDDIVKEIILDFEILPYYDVFLCLDDRQQVVDMFRRRGLTVFQVAPGDF